MTEYVNEYVVEVETLQMKLSHLNGVSWYMASIPSRRHECWAQTDAWVNYFTQVWRCACGAICHPTPTTRVWLEKNSRRGKNKHRFWRRG